MCLVSTDDVKIDRLDCWKLFAKDTNDRLCSAFPQEYTYNREHKLVYKQTGRTRSATSFFVCNDKEGAETMCEILNKYKRYCDVVGFRVYVDFAEFKVLPVVAFDVFKHGFCELANYPAPSMGFREHFVVQVEAFECLSLEIKR